MTKKIFPSTTTATVELNRRRLVQGTAAIGAASALSIPWNRLNAQDTITFWYATNPAESQYAEEFVESWNGSNDVQVNAQPVPAGNSTEEVVLAAIAAGTTPCVLANVAPAAVPQWGQSLVNLTSEFDDGEQFLVERSTQETIDQYRSADGGLFQVPWKVNPVMVFYNMGLFEEAGLDPDNPPRTYSEALETMGALREAGITSIQPSIDQTWYERWFDWYPLYLAAGNQLLLNEDATEAIFNNDAARSAMSFWRDVYENEYAPQATAQQDPFSQRNVAMRMAGPWAIPEIEQGGVLEETGVMPVWVPDDAPQSEDMPVTFADTKSIGIFSNCDDLEGAWSFVKEYVSAENDARFFELSQQIPLREGIADQMPETFYEDYPQLRAFAEQAVHTLNLDQHPRSADIFAAISLAYQSAAIYAEQSVDDALAEAEAAVNELVSNG